MFSSLPLAFLLLLDAVVGECSAPSPLGRRSAVEVPENYLQRLSDLSSLRRRDYSEENATSTILPLALSEDGRCVLVFSYVKTSV